MKSYSVETGDGIIQDFSISFKEQKTSFVLERWEYNNLERITLIFTGVVLQDFEYFSDFNCISDIGETSDAVEFQPYWQAYLDKWQKHVKRHLAEIAQGASWRYFFISTSGGLDGFVICKDFELTTAIVLDGD
ncbi:hypothetical protein FNT36_01180 [Hymenobacter setariae]|uniref:Uncharacterized protein n=1 Tax=Hymenobacter setariae TaxID=2594794 RepID=A0A558C1Z0_9BACT|nr:hypothetical protein [Hymenobacter setariae]TVT42736.1 hypothetical protein FNT36_01180 [Hymenobacter setariae]